jgi:hypothetical protein
LSLSLLLLLTVSAPSGVAPDWNKQELKLLLSRWEAASHLQTPEERDLEFARTVGAAYRVTPGPGESLDDYCRRVTKQRDPAHPAVKAGQWLLAASRKFYEDVARRAETLSRFETDRRDRAYLDQNAKLAKNAAEIITKDIQMKVDGAEGFIAPLPTAPGDPPTKVGVEAMVRQGKISLDNLDRATFPGDAPPEEIERTATGAVRELVAAQKNYNLRADTIGMVDKNLKKGKGQLRVFIPGGAPALYLNELARAAKEAAMHTVYVMVHDPKDGKLRQIPFALTEPKRAKKPKKGQKEAVGVRCHDADSMQTCVTKVLDAAEGAPMLYRVE